MGYSNKTAHYELPQYVANDKPSWLGDFNSAMLKIDTVLADNDATAEAANSAATGAQTQVAALSSQLSTIQGQVNTAVDTATTADGKATTAQTVATQANTAAGEAKTLAESAKNTANAATEVANAAVPKAGGTMTGSLILNGAPTEDNQAATKAYVDSSGGVVNGLTAESGYTFRGVSYYTSKGIFISGVFMNLNAQTPVLFKIQGNPLNLTAGSLTVGAFISASTTPGASFAFNQQVHLKYDGSFTTVEFNELLSGNKNIGALALQYIVS